MSEFIVFLMIIGFLVAVVYSLKSDFKKADATHEEMRLYVIRIALPIIHEHQAQLILQRKKLATLTLMEKKIPRIG
jgi:hypothetical protein